MTKTKTLMQKVSSSEIKDASIQAAISLNTQRDYMLFKFMQF